MTENRTDSTDLAVIYKAGARGYRRTQEIDIAVNPEGLTLLEGNCLEGKTSFLIALLHGIMGPTWVEKNGKTINTKAEVIPGSRGTRSIVYAECTNGMRIERRFTDKNDSTGNLEVTLPDGSKGNQSDVDQFWSSVALRPQNMGGMSERDRLKFLLGGLKINCPDILERFEAAEEGYKQATAAKEESYRLKELAQKHANDLDFFEHAPEVEKSTADILQEREERVKFNEGIKSLHSLAAGATREREQAEAIATSGQADLTACQFTASEIKAKIAALQEKLKETTVHAEALEDTLEVQKSKVKDAIVAEQEALKKAAEQQEKPLDDVTEELNAIDRLNSQVRANKLKAEKNTEAETVRGEWREASRKQDEALKKMGAVVASADIPVPGLGVDGMLVTYQGEAWAGISGMQRLIVETAIASLYNPNARLVLVDGMEALDTKRLEGFHRWACSRGLQTIGTRVSDTPGESGNGVLRFWINDGKVEG